MPLGRFDQADGYLIVASNGGQPTHPAWYLNLKNKPQATIQVGNKVMTAAAEVLTGDARAQAWQQITTAAPMYANYETKTTRQIPVVLLRPNP